MAKNNHLKEYSVLLTSLVGFTLCSAYLYMLPSSITLDQIFAVIGSDDDILFWCM